MLRIEEHKPRKITALRDKVEVSSVYYDVYVHNRLTHSCNETCVFFGSGENDFSKVYGKYEDHDEVVRILKELQSLM